MFKSFRIGRIFGIPIKLDITFLLILPVFAWIIAAQLPELVNLVNGWFGMTIAAEPLEAGRTPWLVGFLAAIGLFACVVLHELGHSVAAIRYGFPIESITLWLLGGVAQLTETPTDWRQELVIAIAGPVVSVALGIGFWLSAFVVPADMEIALFLVAYLAAMNIVLAAFNMLPGFPMDGGRVLRALLARNQPFAVATAKAARVGKIFAVGLGLLGLVAFNFILIALALFIYIAATGESRYVALQAALEGVSVGDLMTPGPELDVVSPDIDIDRLVDLMYRHRHTGFPVVENGDIVGIVTLDDIRSIPPEDRATVQVREIMSTDLTTVRPDDEAFDAITALQQNDIGRVLVVTDRGDLAGLVSRSDIVTALNINAVRSVQDVPAGPQEDQPQVDTLPAAEGRPRW